MENLFGSQEQQVVACGGRRVRLVVDQHGNILVDEVIFTPQGHTIKLLWQETVWFPGKEDKDARV